MIERDMGIADEFEGVDLGDERRDRRLKQMVGLLEEDPSKSVAGAMRDEAGREGAYRLLSNEAVEMDAILAPHFKATSDRARETKRVVVAHDTTEIGFPTAREGLGRINDSKMGRGFFMHTALVVSNDERRDPLGVIGAQRFLRMKPPAKKKERHSEVVDESDKESARWWELVDEVSRRLSSHTQAVHVMDREADNYVLFARLIAGGHRFVIRARHDRRIELEGHKEPTLRKALAGLEGRVRRGITIAPREPKPLAKTVFPPNRVRDAHLEFRATTVTICRPKPSPATDMELPETVELNVVHVVEINPPQGYDPIDWKLETTEPISTSEEIAAIVDAYDRRWVIEEYFKALKTGCAIEKRELEGAHSIFNLLGMMMPIAWKLLRLKSLARTASATEPASLVATRFEILVLQRHKYTRMTTNNPTVRDVFLAVARLGSHIKNNGPPGWQVLSRGYLELIALAEGLALARGLTEDDYL
jgi:hypothetical protein